MPRTTRTRDVLGDLDLDLVLVDDLGDLADEPAGGDDRVAAADIGDHLAVLALLLLLRAQDAGNT